LSATRSGSSRAIVISSIETDISVVQTDGWTVDAYRELLRRMLEESVLTSTPASSA
jgi:hypothetical protein